MSAFVVEPETIGKIIAYFERDNYTNPVTYGCIPRKLAGAGYVLVADDETCRLAADMHRMNVEAVCQRYEDDSPSNYTFNYTVEYQPMRCPTDAQALKALNCFLYQCSEGDVPERPLFKVLDGIRDAMTIGMVNTLPEYQAAEWR